MPARAPQPVPGFTRAEPLPPNQPARQLHPRRRNTPVQAPRLQPPASPDAQGQGRPGGDRRGMRGLHPRALTEPPLALGVRQKPRADSTTGIRLCANVAASGVCAQPLPNRDQRKAPPGYMVRFLGQNSPSNQRSSDSEGVNRGEINHEPTREQPCTGFPCPRPTLGEGQAVFGSQIRSKKISLCEESGVCRAHTIGVS